MFVRRSIYMVMCTVLLWGCANNEEQERSSTNANSIEVNDAKERVTKLSELVTMHTEILDCEYDLFNVNGLNPEKREIGVPGASSFNYKCALRIPSGLEMNWVTDLSEVGMENYDLAWFHELVSHRKENWETEYDPLSYINKDSGARVTIFLNEGIVLLDAVAE